MQSYNSYERRVSARLAIAIYLFPMIFAWFTLREGYTASARMISLGYMVFTFALTFAVLVLGLGLAVHDAKVMKEQLPPVIAQPAEIEDITLPAPSQ